MKNKNQSQKERGNTPIMVANKEWELPENLMRWVKEERMINGLINFIKPLSPEESVGYAECCAYLYPEIQKRLLRSDVTKIYLYCFTQMMKKQKMFDTIPKECIVEELTNYEKSKLSKFKKWIYKSRGGEEKNPILNALKEVFKNEK